MFLLFYEIFENRRYDYRFSIMFFIKYIFSKCLLSVLKSMGMYIEKIIKRDIIFILRYLIIS